METNVHVRVKRLIRSRHLISEGQTLVVAVSGGADSLVLLHILNRIKDELKIQLHVATLDHGLRGEAGAADAQFVEDTARAWELPVTRGKADVNARAAEWREGIEAAARRARYEFLADVARQTGAWIVATAHTADDQAETMLMHLIRGAGVRGLTGMSFDARLPYSSECVLIRPLLLTPRETIDAYVRAFGLSPRTDETNTDTTYFRNRIRHELMPVLKTYNPIITQSLAQTADILSDELTSVEQKFGRLVLEGENLQSIRGAYQIALEKLRALPRAMQRRYLRWAVREVRGSEDGETGYTHIENTLVMLDEGKTGSITLLADNLQARLDYDVLWIEKINTVHYDEKLPLLNLGEACSVVIPGSTDFGERFCIEAAFTAPEYKAEVIQIQLAIPDDMSVRLSSRRGGDTFCPLGMKGHRKTIKRWMIDAKVPAVIRDRVPLLIVNDQIAAVLWGTPAIDERFAVQSQPGERVVYFVVRESQKKTGLP
ncbi:MAG: tRNA lysidine(34) synthetase TilS [Anaerolineae bacterium]